MSPCSLVVLPIIANYCHLCAPADRPLGPFSCTLPCPVLSQRDLKPQSQPLATRIRFSRILHVRASISPCSILSTTSAKLLSQLHRRLLFSLKRRFPVLPLSALRTMSRRLRCLTLIGRTCCRSALPLPHSTFFFNTHPFTIPILHQHPSSHVSPGTL